MALPNILFYVFAFLTLLCGVLVIANPFSRNPVTSAMFLVLTIISMAGLFVLLHAFFLAAVQILVYAGAVMVLFLFVIMLLDLKEEERRKIKIVRPDRWPGFRRRHRDDFCEINFDGAAGCEFVRARAGRRNGRARQIVVYAIPAAVRSRLRAAARGDDGRDFIEQKRFEMKQPRMNTNKHELNSDSCPFVFIRG